MIKPLLLSVFLFFTFFAFSQNGGTISGKIADSNTSHIVSFANIVVVNQDSNKVIGGAVSNDNGEFSVLKLPKGTYVIKISFLGYESFEMTNVKVDSGVDTYVGTILLKEKLTKLDEVNILAERPMIVQGLGKTTLNVNESLIGSGESGLDLVQYLPSVSTDDEDNVLLRGRPATVLIDGVETDMEKVLESLPIGAIDKLEVITNPSAKYSSKNGAGIINIVLKKDKLKGANGRLNAAIGTPEKVQLGGSLMLKAKKWTFSSNVNHNYFIDEISSRNLRNTERETDTSFMKNKGESLRSINNFVYRQGVNLRINRSSYLHLYGTFRYNTNSYQSVNAVNNFYADSTLKNENKNTSNGKVEKSFWSVNAKYAKKFSDTKELSIIAKHEQRNNTDPYFRTINYFDVLTAEQKENYTTQDRLQPEQIYSDQIKADYEHEFNKHFKLETGSLLLYRKTQAQKEMLKIKYLYNEPDQNFDTEIDSSQNYEYEITEWLPSAYVLLSTKFGKWNISSGLRYEYAHLSSYSPTNDTLIFSEYHSILPSLQISKRVNKTITISLSASNRLKMPNYKQLNPFISYHGLYSKSGGNPNLKPENIWNIEFNTQSQLKKHSINTSVFYRHFGNTIGNHQHIVLEDSIEVSFRQFQNLGNVNQIGLEINSNSRFSKTTRLKLNLILMNQQITHSFQGEYINIEDYTYGGKATFSQSFFKTYQCQLTGVYNSNTKTISGTKYGLIYLNLRLKKSVLNKKGSINLLFTDVFNTLEHRSVNSHSANFVTDNYSKKITRKVILSFNYRFSTIKSK